MATFRYQDEERGHDHRSSDTSTAVHLGWQAAGSYRF
jgi:hypothetical protein